MFKDLAGAEFKPGFGGFKPWLKLSKFHLCIYKKYLQFADQRRFIICGCHLSTTLIEKLCMFLFLTFFRGGMFLFLYL